ncbi:glycosyltransferase family 4 protein [bacterium]|nr:glycosyltransferase family 4 protein [bacterium]
MRIAVVTQPYYPNIGGITEHVHHTAMELRRLGHEVDVITSRVVRGGDPGTPDMNGAAATNGTNGSNGAADTNGANGNGIDGTAGLHRIGRNVQLPHFGGFSSVCAGWNLRGDLDRIFRAREFDVIHIHQPLVPTLPLAAVERAPADAAVVGTFHAAGPRSLGYRVARPVLQRFAERIDARIAVSGAARRFASQYFPGHYRLIPNGVDTERFHPRGPRLPQADASRPTLLFVGRFYRRKGLPVLLRAMPAIAREIPGVRLLVVGEGPHGPSYRRLARRLDVPVEFLGELPVSALPAAYRTADAFVAPSTDRESFGVIHLEAMASGTPIIASDIEGYRELLDGEREARLFPNRNADALAATAIAVLRDERTRHAMAAAGRAKAERYSWPGIARTLEALYFDLLDRRTTSGDARIRLAS